MTASAADRVVKNAASRALRALAGPSLLSIVLASSPVYAFAPPAAPTAKKAAPKASPAKGKAAATPKPTATEAAGKGESAGKGKPAGQTGKSAKTVPGGKTVLDDEILIEGKLEKPSAYYILRRSSLDYDWARLTAEFSPLVLESVQDPLF